MSRINKKTRIKGIPPKLQLQTKDAATGSYPTTVRLASDNRTGKYRVGYDDENTLVFGTYYAGDLLYYQYLDAYWSLTSPSDFSSELGLLYPKTEVWKGQPYQGSRTTKLVLSSSSAHNNIGEISSKIQKNEYDSAYKFKTSGIDKSYYLTQELTGSDEPLRYFDDTTDTHSAFGYSFWFKGSVDNVGRSGQSISLIRKQRITNDGVGTSSGEYIFSVTTQAGYEKFEFSMTRRGGSASPYGYYEYKTEDSPEIESLIKSFFEDGEWHHLAFSWDGNSDYTNDSSYKLFIDGTLINTSFTNDSLSSDYGISPYLRVGSSEFFESVDYEMYMSDLAAWNFPSAEVANSFIWGSVINSQTNLQNFPNVAGYNLPANSKWLESPEQKTDILLPEARVLAGVSDTLVHFTPGQDLEPFRDNNNPAADGKSSNNPFYATGSAVSLVGEGFDQPLWSKTKIEIDISSKPCSFIQRISQSWSSDIGEDPLGYVSGSSYPMAYYNFDNQNWEGIGTGWALSRDSRHANDIFDEREEQTFGTYGFSSSIINLAYPISSSYYSSDVDIAASASYLIGQPSSSGESQFLKQRTAGHPNNTYGFPYAAQYHATSSQLLNMSDYIREPFLLEKIVVEISGAQFTMFDSIDSNGVYDLSASVFPFTVNNFFIMRQYNSSNSFSQPLTAFSDDTFVNTARDLVTYLGISAFSSSVPTEKSIHAYSMEEYERDGYDSYEWWSVPSATNPVQPDSFLPEGLSQSLSFHGNPRNNISRECNIILETSIETSLEGLSWERNLKIEGNVISPSIRTIPSTWNSSPTEPSPKLWNPKFQTYRGGRNGTDLLRFERSKTNPIKNIKTAQKTSQNLFLGIDPTGTIRRHNGCFDLGSANTNSALFGGFFGDDLGYDTSGPSSIASVNPYLLLPGDKMVFGWQQPMPDRIVNAQNEKYNNWLELSMPIEPKKQALVDLSQMSFNGPAKIVFYGSTISENKEHHDTLNQLISSKAIHEVIQGKQYD